jgi:formamidopyrimidine-DNA glycosylase
VPELPEVETVRDGLQRWVVGRTIAGVEINHSRAVRRHLAGAADLRARLVGARVEAAVRRGKYLWLPLAHIARDPMDPWFDEAAFAAKVRRRDSAIKRALLDQTLVSGIGNIYADESLWRARLHGERLSRTLTRSVVLGLLARVREVLAEAVSAGGTSFDALYVNVNGQSGYFDRSLAVYGREDEACLRCGTPIRRVAFMNRSSFFCPSCQRPPRVRHAPRARPGGAPVPGT